MTSIDWTVDAQQFQSASLQQELLYCMNVLIREKIDDEIGNRLGASISSSEAMRDADWFTWTSTVGWPVQGVFTKGCNTTCVVRSFDQNLLLVGDLDASVKLYRYPCVIENVCKLKMILV